MTTGLGELRIITLGEVHRAQAAFADLAGQPKWADPASDPRAAVAGEQWSAGGP